MTVQRRQLAGPSCRPGFQRDAVVRLANALGPSAPLSLRARLTRRPSSRQLQLAAGLQSSFERDWESQYAADV